MLALAARPSGRLLLTRKFYSALLVFPFCFSVRCFLTSEVGRTLAGGGAAPTARSDLGAQRREPAYGQVNHGDTILFDISTPAASRATYRTRSYVFL